MERFISGVSIFVCLSGTLWGQAGPAAVEPRGGFGIYSLSAYSGYVSVALPDNGFGVLGTGYLPSAFSWGSDVNVGGAASMGWRRSGTKGRASLTYSASYYGMVHHSELNSMNHAFSFSAGRKLGNKWDFSISAAGSYSDLNQFLFAPTLLSSIAAVPVTMDDLAAAMLAGTSTNNQLASILAGAPLIESPARTAIYGDRVLNGSFSTSLSYAPTTRLSFHLQGGLSRAQYVNTRKDSAEQFRPLVPQTSGGSAGAGMSYSLTPRTQVGLDVSASRTFSVFQDAYTGTGTASIGRRMGKQWFAQAHAGTGFISARRETLPLPRGPQYIVGGSLGYKTFAHSFVASADRSVADSFGLGAEYTIITTGAWNWRRPGSAWGFSTSVSRQEMRGMNSFDMKGWMAGAGLTRALSRRASMQVSYAYMVNSGQYTGLLQNFTVHAVRLAVTWAPDVTW